MPYKVFCVPATAEPSDDAEEMNAFLRGRKIVAVTRDFGIRFNSAKPSWLETHFTDIDGTRKPFRLLSLPHYLAPHWRRLAESVMDS